VYVVMDGMMDGLKCADQIFSSPRSGSQSKGGGE
jgi:hypothetical protein